jgi:hypothetical protein
MWWSEKQKLSRVWVKQGNQRRFFQATINPIHETLMERREVADSANGLRVHKGALSRVY